MAFDPGISRIIKKTMISYKIEEKKIPKLGSKPQYGFEHSEIYSAIFFIPLWKIYYISIVFYLPCIYICYIYIF